MDVPRRQAALVFIFVTAVIDVVAMGIVIPVLPALIEEFAGSNARAGTINGVFIALWALMQLLASPLVGSLSDRFGRRPILLLSAAGLAADYVLIALAPNLWWLALGRIIAGITAASFGTANAYLADVTPPKERTRAYGLLGAAFSGGFVAGPLLGGVLGEIGPRAPFWVAGALSGLSFVYGLFVLPESLPAHARTPFAWSRANPFGAVRLLGRSRELTGMAVVTFLLMFAHHVFSSVFVLYAGERYHWSSWHVGVLLGLVGVLDMITQGLVVSRVVARWGERRTLVFGMAMGAVSLAMMGLAPTGPLFVLTVIPNALWGLAMPPMQSMVTSLVSEGEQGQLQGATGSVNSVAGVIAPMVFGAVYSMSVGSAPRLPHPGAAFFLASAVLALCAWVGARVSKRIPTERAEGSASVEELEATPEVERGSVGLM